MKKKQQIVSGPWMTVMEVGRNLKERVQGDPLLYATLSLQGLHIFIILQKDYFVLVPIEVQEN